MNFLDIQIYAVIKLLYIVFIAAGIFIVYKKKSPLYFLTLAGVASALGYYCFVDNLQLLLWGLQGDEITIAAMYNTFAQVGFGVDFAYHGLSAFYPPAWFWLFGAIGSVLHLNGIVMAKLAATVFFLIFPVGLYYFQKQVAGDSEFKLEARQIFMWLAPLMIMTVLPKDLLIGKPYEVIAAAATIFWYISLFFKVTKGKLNNKQVLLYGVVAGIIFVTYYLWLVFAALAFLVSGLVEKEQRKLFYFWSLFKTMLVALVVSLPFTAPLISSYVRVGMESWQTAFFTPDGLDLWLPMFQLTSINNLILLFGLGALIYFRQRPIVKQLAYLLLTAFMWWVLGLLSLLILKKPFQEFRGFYILSPMILILAATYGVEQLWKKFKINDHENWRLTIGIIAVVYFAMQSIFGIFIDDPRVKTLRIEAKHIGVPIANLVSYLKTVPNVSNDLTLQTVPQVLAFVPLNHLIYFNQHNNHPAAIWSARYKYVESLAAATSAEDFYRLVKACPYGQLKRFIMYSDSNNYYLYFHTDKIIAGIETKEIKINKKLFTSTHFKKVYDQNGYVVIEVMN